MNLEFWASNATIAGTIILILGILGKVLIVNPLKHYIKDQTSSIQPNSNGGKSLPDVARNVIEIKTCLESLIHQIDRVESRLDTHIEQHVEGKA